MKVRKSFCAAILGLGLGFMADEASAKFLLTVGVGAVQSGTSGAAYLDINGAAGSQTTRSFNTTVANQLVRVIFTADAYVSGNNYFGLDGTILIDNSPCNPTGTSSALISGSYVFGVFNSNPASVVMQCIAAIPVIGSHDIRVLITPNNASEWRIQSLSLVLDSN